MLAKFKSLREEREEAFTLIELLVVILIIGILAVIAIPAFLNQRQTAIDGTVVSDVKNASLGLEEWVLDQKGKNTPIPTNVLEAYKVKASNGVTLTASGTANAYCILGAHSNGKDFKPATPAKYDNTLGGLNRDVPAGATPACIDGIKIVDGVPVTSSGAAVPNASGVAGEGATSGDNGDGTNPEASGPTPTPTPTPTETPGEGGVILNPPMPGGGEGETTNYPTEGNYVINTTYYDAYDEAERSMKIDITKNNGNITTQFTAGGDIYEQFFMEITNLQCYPDPYNSVSRGNAPPFMPSFDGGRTATEVTDLNVNGLCNIKSFTVNASSGPYSVAGPHNVTFEPMP